jgi:hypothetical protein
MAFRFETFRPSYPPAPLSRRGGWSGVRAGQVCPAPFDPTNTQTHTNMI